MTRALPFAIALLLLALAGAYGRPVSSTGGVPRQGPSRVEVAQAAVKSRTHPVSPERSSLYRPAYTPEPERISRVLLPGETLRVPSVEQWRAAHYAFPAADEWWAIRTMLCESGGDPTLVGDHGDSIGAFQVQPRWWGAVPADLDGQARQAARIVAEHGRAPWTTSAGCAAFNTSVD